MKIKNVLSLFHGIGCINVALERAGVEFDDLYTSEIDKYATIVDQKNNPKNIQLGDITSWQEWNIDWSSIDLVVGGFPCQAWSVAGKQLGDRDERGMLFWTMLDVMKKVRQHNLRAHFLIENVKMKKEFEEYITRHMCEVLGMFEYDKDSTGEMEYLIEECKKKPLHKILINSSLVSAQNRNRYYWTSFECSQPEDKGLVLADIIESDFVDRDKSYCLDANYYKGGNLKTYFDKKRRQLVFLPDSAYSERCKKQIIKNSKHPNQKSIAVCTNGNMTGSGVNVLTYDNLHYRKLTPIECERLQTLPDNYTAHVSNTQRYKMIGNGWTVDVIAHLLNQLSDNV